MCLHCALCSIPFNLICNMTTFSKKKGFDFDHTLGSRVCIRTENVLAFVCYAPFPLIGYET